MDGNILSLLILQFKAASQHWAIDLVNLLEPSWFVFSRLAFLLLIIAAWFARERGLAILCVGVLWLGFTHYALTDGWTWADSLSHGVRNVSARLGVPAYDPSAIVELGTYVAKPLFSATATQGTLSFLRTIWTGGVFVLAGFGIFLAFGVLAFVQFALLIINYLLIGAAPFFLLFLAVPGLNALSLLWIRLMTGSLASLFVVGLIAGIMRDFSGQMADRYHAVFASAVDVTTLTWTDWGGPLMTAIIMAVSFAWIPLRFFREGAAVAGDLWSSAGVAFSMGASIVMSQGSTENNNSNGGGGSSNAQGAAPTQSSGSGSSGSGSRSSSGGSGMGAPQSASAQWGGAFGQGHTAAYTVRP